MALNFSDISAGSKVGRLLRASLSFLPKAAVVPIIQGPLRGKRWVVGSSNHGCWLGSFELAKQRAIADLVRPGWSCWDVGANVGFYTLFFSQLVGPRGRVVAFEPAPVNIPQLERHLRINGCANVDVVKAAVTNFDGEATFDERPGSMTGYLCPTGQTRVRCCKVDTLVESGGLRTPDLVKIDVEGAEAQVLQGAQILLRHRRPVLLVATHGPKPQNECIRLLTSMGYSVRNLENDRGPLADELVALPSQ